MNYDDNDEYKYDIISVWLLPYYKSLNNKEKRKLKEKCKKKLDMLGANY